MRWKKHFAITVWTREFCMLQDIYTVLLQGRLWRWSIIYGYCLCVHIAFCHAGLKQDMSYRFPKWQRWRSKRGESRKTTIFHFYVIACHTTAFMFLSSTPCLTLSSSVHYSSDKKRGFGFCRCGLCVVSLQRWLTRNTHFLQILEWYICTKRCWRNWYDGIFAAPLWLFRIVGVSVTIDLLL